MGVLESHPVAAEAATEAAAKVSRIGSSSNNNSQVGDSDETSASATTTTISDREVTRCGRHSMEDGVATIMRSSSTPLAMMARPRTQRLCSSAAARQHHPPRRLLHLHAVLSLMLFVVFSSLGNNNHVLVSAGSTPISSSRNNNINRNTVSSFNINATMNDENDVLPQDESSSSDSSSNKAGHYVPMWAVEIPGGIQVADDVARHHGFINHGRVSVSGGICGHVQP